MNSHHPDPGRVGKVGSGARLPPPLQLDRLDPLDQLKSFRTSVFVGRAGEFDQFTCKACPRKGTRYLAQGTWYLVPGTKIVYNTIVFYMIYLVFLQYIRFYVISCIC